MKKGIFIFMILMTLISNVWANQNTNFKDTRAVIDNWFIAMKENNVTNAANYLAPTFVSIHTDGKVRNKEQEIELIKNLQMKSYNLSHFQFSQTGASVVVTFQDLGNEKIDNDPIADKKAGRMAVLQKDHGKWIIIAYANLDEIK